MNFRALLEKVKAGFDYNPGCSDLDDEQPIHVRMTLGDYRQVRCLLAAADRGEIWTGTVEGKQFVVLTEAGEWRWLRDGGLTPAERAEVERSIAVELQQQAQSHADGG